VTLSVRVLYLVRREGFSSVFASQIARRMGAIAESGFDVAIAVLATPGQWLKTDLRAKWAAVVAAVPESINGKVSALPALPSRFNWPLLESAVFRWWLRGKTRRGTTAAIVQCRNTAATQIALRARQAGSPIRVIFDCRGVVDHEFLYDHGYHFDDAPPALRGQALQLSEQQRLCAQNADAVFCVSDAMVKYLVADAGIARDKCTVIPCCVETDTLGQDSSSRHAIRARYGLEDKLVVCYCGSLVGYQRIEHSLTLFRQIAAMDPRAHFYAVTTSAQKMRDSAMAAGLREDQLTVVSVAPDQVPAMLSAADVGLLLRERSPVNEVASPVKFAEYLASGTPVIVSAGVGDFSALVRAHQVGLTLDDYADAELTQNQLEPFLKQLAEQTENMRNRCTQVAAEQLTFAPYLSQVSRVYERLGQAAQLESEPC